MNNAKRQLIPKILFLASLVYLIVLTLQNRIGYHDVSVMQGIVTGILFLIFSFTFLFFFSNEKAWNVAMYSSIYLSALNSLPSLKYSLPYGTADALVHLALVKGIYIQGHIPVMTYSDFPIMHVFLASLSIIGGAPLLQVFKYALPVIMGLFPLFIYMASKIIFRSEELRRYVVFSSTLLFSNYNYALFAASLATFFILVIVTCLLRARSPKDSFLALFLIVLLVMTHSVTSFTLTFALVMIQLFFRFHKRYSPQQSPKVDRVLQMFSLIGVFSVVSLLVWWMYQTSFVFTHFMPTLWRFILIGQGPQPLPVEAGLSKYGIWTIMQLYVGKLEIFVLSVLGLCILLFSSNYRKMIKDKIALYTSVAFAGANIVLLVSEFNIVDITVSFRAIVYGFLVAPFFSGSSFYYLSSVLRKHIKMRTVSNCMKVFIFCLLLSLGLFEFFPHETPNLALNYVNSEYQYQMIKFVGQTLPSDSQVVADELTHWQVEGFSTPEIFQRIISTRAVKGVLLYVPSVDARLQEYITTDYYLVLIHRPGKSGFIYEYPKVNASTINNGLQNTGFSVIYNNGESYVIVAHSPR